MEVGANATVHVARETVRVLATTADLADELWRGIDLIDMEMHRAAVRAMGTDCEGLANWVSLGGGNSVPLALRSDLAELIASVTHSVFDVEQQRDRFWAQGRFLTFHLRARWRRAGSCVTTFVVANTTFVPVWMGYYWDVMGFSPQSQSRQIIVKLYEALALLEKPPKDLLVIDDDTVAVSDIVFRCFAFVLMVGFGWAMAESHFGHFFRITLLQWFRAGRSALCCLCRRGSRPVPPRSPERFDLLTPPGLRVDSADKSSSASTSFSTCSPGGRSASPRALSVTDDFVNVSPLRLLSEAT